jgi:hypothetical protein
MEVQRGEEVYLLLIHDLERLIVEKKLLDKYVCTGRTT